MAVPDLTSAAPADPIARYDLVIFDCDGVLVDSERLTHQVLCDQLAELDVAMTLAQAIDRFIGTSNALMLERVAALLPPGAMPADFLAQFRQRTQQAFAAGLRAVPGVEAVLDGLALPHCVASNGEHAKMAVTLALTGLAPRFAGRVFSADDVARPKPAPDLFLHAAATLGAAPARCLVIEDSATGVRAARAAGMAVFGHAALTPADRLLEAGAHRVFATMAELPPLLALPAAR